MAKNHLTCKHCSVQFERRKPTSKTLYCSRQCKRDETNAMGRARRKPPSPITASMRVVCEGCGSVGGKTNSGLCRPCSARNTRIRQAIHMRVVKGNTHMPPRITDERAKISYDCMECGKAVTLRPHYGRSVSDYKFCSKVCGRRSSDRIATRARRAATMGADAEPVDYNVVFARDAWRCGLCGVKTLRSKRGTAHSKAPVVDHIIPLSKGGPHTYRNVQCACYSCNSSKGADLIGQLRLFG